MRKRSQERHSFTLKQTSLFGQHKFPWHDEQTGPTCLTGVIWYYLGCPWGTQDSCTADVTRDLFAGMAVASHLALDTCVQAITSSPISTHYCLDNYNSSKYLTSGILICKLNFSLPGFKIHGKHLNANDWEEFDVVDCVGTAMTETSKKFVPAPALMLWPWPSQCPPAKKTWCIWWVKCFAFGFYSEWIRTNLLSSDHFFWCNYLLFNKFTAYKTVTTCAII